MEPRAFDDFTERVRSALDAEPGVVGLVTLGTTADPALRDVWSDHDFWIVTESGAQDTFLEDLSWLPDAQSIAIVVCHGKRYRTVVYRNRHKVEFAVLDVDEAREGTIERYGVLIDRGGMAELAASIRQRTHERARTRAAWADALQNLCVLVWAACERYSRGEMLSARRYLDGFAVDELLRLVSAHAPNGSGIGVDVLDGRRRLEMRAPGLAAEILRLLDEAVPVAAGGLLGLAEQEVKAWAPDLAWGEVTMVRRWISELAREQGQPNERLHRSRRTRRFSH